ncbi:hypothetical protein A8709_25070 [Paenibacillus pectinilyticus]|uniref:Hyaluronate lyase n=1 Tax=Paenibacillus pectinilyticus TaxID=512399 RepID=A0A1C1A2B0_9BACL|nr:polysaccharide lyase 8 family protein [Paenibacillus pectinilyticus]OCT14657.1 hypothetical protein A8709_25070 [Paenibacillus pectinilyticus]
MSAVVRLGKKTFLYLLLLCVIVQIFGVAGVQTAQAADEYDSLRTKLVNNLVGSGYSTADPDIAARITQIDADANTYWSSLIKTGARTYLWSDLTTITGASQSLGRLKAMTIAYKTTGSSLAGNTTLKSDIISGIDWIYGNWYSENVDRDSSNWWSTEVSASKSLGEMTAMLYDDLSAAQKTNYIAAMDHFDPTPKGFTGDYVAANRIWKANIVMMSGILSKSSVKLNLVKDTLSQLFEYVNTSDGMYEDGSYFQHAWFPYAGGYGLAMLADLSNVLFILTGSSWAITDPDVSHVYDWVYRTYEPIAYNGLTMDAFRGREISRYMVQDQISGDTLIAAVASVSRFAPSPHAANFKSMVKYWVQSDQTGAVYAAMSLTDLANVKSIMNDSAVVSRGELIKHVQYPNEDRFVHLRPGWGFTVGMYSNKTKNYESINGENLKAWHTSDGMTYLYNNDYTQFSDNYWATVNPYRLPGTTVDTLTRANASGISAPWNNTITWAGGTQMDGLYGVEGMYLAAELSTLKAKKSWFMFDDEVVNLGSDIDSTDSRTIETVVENRKLNAAGNNDLVVNGVSKSNSLGWSETMTGVNSMYLEGTGGYYFPTATTIKGKRYARSGDWGAINSAYTDGVTYTRNYMELVQDHGINPTDGTYAYVLLPNKSAAETAAYAANPNIQILENSTSAHAVSENTLGMKGYNFWNDAVKTVGELTVNKKSSVMTKESGNTFDISISDPTQANTGTISVEIAKSAAGVVSYDDGITVTQLSPTIKFTVNVNKADGYNFKAKFKLFDVNSTFDADTTGGYPAGWSKTENGGTVSVVADPSATDKSVKINQTSATAGTGSDITSTFTETGSTSIEASVKVDAVTNWSGIYVGNSAGSTALSLAFDTGMLKANVGGTWQNVQAYAAGTWYAIKIVLNPSTDLFDLYVNGTLKLSQVAFRAPVTDVGQLRFFTNNTVGAMYVNNAKVYANVTAPTPPVRPTPAAAPAAPIVSATDQTTAVGSVLSGWTATTNNTGTVAVQKYYNSGNWFDQSTKMNKTLTGYGMYLTKAFTALTGTIKAAAYLTPTSTTTNWRMIMSSGTTQAVKVVFGADGNIKLNDTTTVMPYRANTPYLVEVKINTVTDTFDLYIDSILRASSAPLKAAVTNIDNMEFSAYSADVGTLYVDNVVVYNYDYQN